MTDESKSDPDHPTRAEKLRAEIEDIVNRGKKKTEGKEIRPQDRPDQPRSLHEVFEERMRDHVGEKKP